MVSVHLLRPCNHMGHRTSTLISCSTLIYRSYLLLVASIDENPHLQRYNVIEKNVVKFNAEIVNYFQLLVFTVSNRWYCFSPEFKIFYNAPVNLLWHPRVPEHTVWEPWVYALFFDWIRSFSPQLLDSAQMLLLPRIFLAKLARSKTHLNKTISPVGMKIPSSGILRQFNVKRKV